MILPDPILSYLKEKHQISVKNVKAVSGGSINQAARVTANGQELFLKWNETAPKDMFDKEVKGLELLREAETGLVIPEVIAYNPEEDDTPGFLLMEYIEPYRGDGEASRSFGKQLARLHSHTGTFFGLDHDNYIGRLPQSNKSHSSWTSFFIHERIEPQLEQAFLKGTLQRSLLANWSRLAGRLEDIFPDSKPSLLHGDLWGGNYFFNNKHQAVLIDPAVYYGHPEMELSFTKMFGGFSNDFYDSYAFESPLDAGFSDRVEIYNLYPLLVHVNLFGGHYASQAISILNRY